MPDKIRMRRGNVANLPTLDDGEFGLAEDTKKVYIGTTSGNQGIVSSQSGAPTYIQPTLLNAWVNFGAGQAVAAYYIDDLGMVYPQGLIKSGTVTAGTQLFILPAGYRPGTALIRSVATNNGSTSEIIQLAISAAGVVSIDTIAAYSTWLNLSDIGSFRAEQ